MMSQKFKMSNVQDWIQELLKCKLETALLHEYAKWEVPRFPVNGKMLQEQGVPSMFL